MVPKTKIATKKRTVMAFGAFDGVHTGHIHYLKEAKKEGDYLIVVIARDKAKWKYIVRYGLPERERKALVESLDIADEVILGSTTDALERIEQRKPDVIAITPYHSVSKKTLTHDLNARKIDSTVIRIKTYKRGIYDLFFTREYRQMPSLMGLTPSFKPETTVKKIPVPTKYAKLMQEMDEGKIVLLSKSPQSTADPVMSMTKILTDQNFSILFLSARKPCTTQLKELKKADANLDHIVLIDTVCGTTMNKEYPANVVHVEHASSLTSISIAIHEAMTRMTGKKVLIIDSISALLVDNAPKTLVDFFYVILEKSRAQKMSALLIARTGLAEKEVLPHLIDIIDTYIPAEDQSIPPNTVSSG